MQEPRIYSRLTGVRRVTVEPGATGMAVAGASCSLGKDLMGSGELLDGQEVMKPEANEYTSSRVKGASNGWGNGASLRLARR